MSLFTTEFETIETIDHTETGEIYTVSQLNAEARLLLEGTFKRVWIMGEISNFSRPQSGHAYFSLKDGNSQVRCAFFRNYQTKLKFIPENGQQVLALAQVSLYEARGDYQLIVQHLELAGSGVLQMAFEQLKNRLAKEGLFDEQHKKPLPTIPKKIGVITSPTGAAIRDILTVLNRRFPSIPVIIYPSLVQGEQAAKQISDAIKTANKRLDCDVLILARGGGSLEDLWPFNEEIVARSIFASAIPIISGVGHEIDFTIADFVADVRAPTPSAAAETVTPDKTEWLQTLSKLSRLIQKCFFSHWQQYQMRLENLNKRLRHPGQRIQEQLQRLDQLEQSLYLAKKNRLNLHKSYIEQIRIHFNGSSLQETIERFKILMQTNNTRIMTFMQHQLKNYSQLLASYGTTLDALSPLKTLDRGFAIISDPITKKIIRDSQETKIGATLEAKLAKGQITFEITSKEDHTP